jgi:CDP-4-dehydro-6-deoxyglucose reductase, E3
VTHRVSLSRAAHLIGVHRSTLQGMVADGRLESADGTVSTGELLRAFPDVQLEDFGDFERASRIKEESFGRRVRERVLPSQEILAQRLFAQSRELADVRRHLQRYHDLVELLQAGLEPLAQSDPAAASLARALDDELARILASDAADPLEVMDDVLKIMSAHVTVRPSGREFFVEGHDTLLQAGLKAALSLNYGCGNGSCGLCKARVISGEVKRVQHHDYALSEAELAQGYALMCCNTPVTDTVIETLEARGPEDIPEQSIVTRVRAVKALAPDTLLLHLQTPRTNRLRFLAGQNVTLGAPGDLRDFHAMLPVASCPCDDRNLHFHIARDADDEFAERLFAGAIKAGDDVTVWGPTGRFVLDAETGRHLVFIACDLGFAPVKSLVEYAISSEATPSCDLLWLATRGDGHYLANQCRAWAAAFDQFRYLPIEATAPDQGAEKIVAASLECLARGECEVFVAGPEAFSQAVAAGLLASGLPSGRLSVWEI